jgi:hypothetical protein
MFLNVHFVRWQTGQYYGYGAEILEQSMRTRNRVGIGLSYQSTRLHWLADSNPLESIPGLLKSLKYPLWTMAAVHRYHNGSTGGELLPDDDRPVLIAIVLIIKQGTVSNGKQL